MQNIWLFIGLLGVGFIDSSEQLKKRLKPFGVYDDIVLSDDSDNNLNSLAKCLNDDPAFIDNIAKILAAEEPKATKKKVHPLVAPKPASKDELYKNMPAAKKILFKSRKAACMRKCRANKTEAEKKAEREKHAQQQRALRAISRAEAEAKLAAERAKSAQQQRALRARKKAEAMAAQAALEAGFEQGSEQQADSRKKTRMS